LVQTFLVRRRITNALRFRAPSGSESWVRDMMVRRDFAAGNKFVAYRTWEREIRHRASVKMAQFKFADPKFASTEAMLPNGYVRPTQQFAFDCFADFNTWFHSSVLG